MKHILMTTKMQRILWGMIFLMLASLSVTSVQATLSELSDIPGERSSDSHEFRVGGKANPRKKIVVSTLSMYQLLVTIQSNINGFLKEILIKDDADHVDAEEVERKQNLSLAARFAADAITLLDKIVFDLNRQCFSYNPEIEYHFIKMCNTLKDVEFASIEPYQIRAQLEQVKQFDQYLKLYCLSRKDFLNKADMDLFNKITKFNEMLMLCLLNEDYFEIGFIDTCLDYTLHRPWELMCEHPYVTATVVLTVAAAVGYFYVYPWWIRYDNNNKEFNVQQDHGLKQGPADCGYYGLLHALIRRNAGSEEEFNAMIARAKGQDNLLQPWKDEIARQREDFIAQQRQAGRSADDIVGMRRGSDWVVDVEIQRILNNANLVHQVMLPVLGGDAHRHVALDNIVVVQVVNNNVDQQAQRAFQHRQQRAYRDAQADAIHDRLARAETDAQKAELRGKLQDLLQPAQEGNVDVEGFAVAGDNAFIDQIRRNNVAQHITLHLQDVDHWVTVSVEPDPESRHGIRAKIVNSMNRNVTDYAAVNRLLRACSIDGNNQG